MTRSDLGEYGPKNGATGRMGPPSGLPTINAVAFRNDSWREIPFPSAIIAGLPFQQAPFGGPSALGCCCRNAESVRARPAFNSDSGKKEFESCPAEPDRPTGVLG
jgi:hypothetical protein